MARRSIYNLLFQVYSVAILVGNFPGIAPAQQHYPNGFPAETDFFPIGVWLQSPEHAAAYKAIGINTFIGLWNGPTEEQLATLARNDMFAVASQNEIGLRSIHGGIIKAWLQDDEPDNAQPTRMGIHVTCVPATEVVRRTKEMKARDFSRPVMVNFGQGVANKYWWGRGLCTGDENYYSKAIRHADILSFDIYPVASPIPQIKNKLEYVARGVDRLVKLAAKDQKVWAIIETTAINPKNAVTPAQIRAEVWMAIIHGATGIVYYVHEFEPTFRGDAIFRHPEVSREVAKINDLVKSLAKPLNSPTLAGTLKVESTRPVAAVVKRYGNALYIFAVAMNNFASKPKFSIQGLGTSKAIVIGEDRDVAVTNGTFEDAFEGYGVHLYKIP